MYKLIVFDWDDVITLGATDGYLACYHEAIKSIGFQVDPQVEKEQILKNWGKTFKEEIESVTGKTPLVDKAVGVFNENFFGNTFVNKLSLVQGVNEFLISLKENYKLAVATGNHPNLLLTKIMPKFNIPNVFSEIMYSAILPNPSLAKPNPYMLETIMKNLGIQKKETLYIGDAKTDVSMAESAGVNMVVVLTGHLNRKQAEELKPWRILEKVTDLKTVL